MSSIRCRNKIVQEHALGCGVACVASRLNTSYKKAHALFENKDAAWTCGYLCADVAHALKRGGINYSYARFDKVWHRPFLARAGTIIFLEPSDKYPVGHYLILTKYGWMNSWINFPEMNPPKSGFQKQLDGLIGYILFQNL